MVHVSSRHVEQVFTMRNRTIGAISDALALTHRRKVTPKSDALYARRLRVEFPLEETNHGVAGYTERIIRTRMEEFIRGGEMFLVEQKQNGGRRAEIYMRPDGLFEGRIYRQESEVVDGQPQLGSLDFEICAVTETLPRVETIVDEELGL